jgi:uncharacterized paraquat-inducible protein A
MRITDAPFSQQEAGLIRRRLETGASALCPRCSVRLESDESIAVDGCVAVRCRLIRCPGCRRMVTLTD